jgi:hypothetical protein
VQQILHNKIFTISENPFILQSFFPFAAQYGSYFNGAGLRAPYYGFRRLPNDIVTTRQEWWVARLLRLASLLFVAAIAFLVLTIMFFVVAIAFSVLTYAFSETDYIKIAIFA